jgi:hypothetical protein
MKRIKMMRIKLIELIKINDYGIADAVVSQCPPEQVRLDEGLAIGFAPHASESPDQGIIHVSRSRVGR